MLSLSKEISELRTHNSEDLERKNMSNDEHSKHHDRTNLNVQLQQAATSLPVETAPCIEESDLARSTEQLADNLSAKGAIEGYDGVLIVGQDGGLDADLGDYGGEAEEEGREDGEEDGGEGADGEAHPLALGVLLEIVLVELVQAQEDRNAAGQVQADVGHGGGDSGGRGEGLPIGPAGDALPERGLRGHGDNLVCPRSVDVGNGRAGKTADEDSLARDACREEGEEEGCEEVDGEGED